VQSFDLHYLMPIRAPNRGFEIFIQEFEAAHRYGGLWVPVSHPFATGRLARWHEVASFLERVLDRRDIWFAPMEEIASHEKGLIDSGAHTPHIEKLPQYQDSMGHLRPPTP
jgi:peptidoglycan-N-acetylglucosamine deacetylase